MTHPLAALIAGVKVKPLEWVEDTYYWSQGLRANCCLGHYVVWKPENRQRQGWDFRLVGSHAVGGFENMEQAKAAAQADYEARILAALEAAPVPDLVEAGKVLEPLSKLADDMDRHATDEWDESELLCRVGDTIRALIALATAQAAQIVGLEAKLDHEASGRKGAMAEFDRKCKEANEQRAEAATLRAEVERLRGALEKINVGEGWAAQIARAALEGKA